jgi:hypothetical protein
LAILGEISPLYKFRMDKCRKLGRLLVSTYTKAASAARASSG